MRLHTLSATAFGPFAETVTVDFDGLSRAGLFLIRGATGAGKTSLLDAVCFALFASVPGPRPAGRGLRSDHAARDAVPSVTLELTAARRRFRVTRSPEFARPKKRGVGETRTPARVELHELVQGGWVPRGSRHDEVALVLADVLGMGLEQFSRVVLLPQGDFAAFLRSTAEDRRVLLERLFDISRFTGIEEWLADERRAGAALVHQGGAALSTDLSRLGDVLDRVPGGTGDVVEDWALLAVEEIPAGLAAVAERAGRHAAETLAAFDAASAADTQAHGATLRAEGLAELHGRAGRAAGRLAGLDADAEMHDRARRQVADAEGASRCSGDLRALRRAEAAAGTAAAELAAAGRDLGREGDWSPDVAGQRLADLGGYEDCLGEALRVAQAVSLRVTRLGGAERRTAHVRRLLDTVAERLTRSSQLVTARERELADVDEVASRFDLLQGEVDHLETVLRLRGDLDAASAEAARLEALVPAARGVEQDARAALLDQRGARLEGMAAELAATLRQGGACPVCGSPEHPAPAQRARVVTAADVAVADRLWTVRRSELTQLERELDGQRQHLATRTRDLDGETREPDELSAALATTQALRDGSDAARSRRGAVAAAAREAVAAVTAAGDARTELIAEQLALRATLDDLRDAQERDRLEVSALLGAHARSCPCAAGSPMTSRRLVIPATGSEAVAAVRAHHVEVSTAVGTHVARAATHAEALVELDRVALDTAGALQAQGFATVAEAEAARIPDAELDPVRRMLRAAQDQRAAALATLADPEIVAASHLAEPDLEALTAAASSARAALLQAREEQAMAERTDRDLRRLREGICHRVAELGTALSSHECVARLADTVAGLSADNTLRMRLSSFVLAARLERVAALANERLAVMGDGRYRLEHSDGLAGGGRRSGLGLLVRDLWTGQARDTSTLSGGESFMASLALALGLADAVREESGGFDLQTLFIDEGFGSLDDDSLEQVMSVLDNLRDGGRAVGVVSHVSDLRGRIPCQVSVEKRANGSTVHLVGLAGPAA